MRSEIVAFTASLMINAAVLSSFESVGPSCHFQRLAQKEKEAKTGAIQFEFIEAPAEQSSRKPEKTKKISDRDSTARDATQKKSSTPPQAPPKMEKEGPADQLEQRRFELGKAPVRASKPSPQQSPSISQTEKEQVKTEIVEPAKKQSQMTSVDKEPSLPSPASLPQTPVRGSAGTNRIDTQAVSRTGSHGAQLYGATSFEATGSGMGKYMKNMKEKIWLAWFPYLSFHYPKDFRSADAVVRFTLNAQGEVKAVKVVDSQGSPMFAAFCVEALRHAGTFGPLPTEVLDLIGKNELEVNFAFHFW